MKVNCLFLRETFILVLGLFFSIQLSSQTRLTNFEGPGSQLWHHFVEHDNQSYHVTIDSYDYISVYKFHSDGSRELIRCEYFEYESNSYFHANEERYLFLDDGILKYNYLSGQTRFFEGPEGFLMGSTQYSANQLSNIKYISLTDEVTEERYFIGFDPEVGFVTQSYEAIGFNGFIGDYRFVSTLNEDSRTYELTSLVDGSVNTITTARQGNSGYLFYRKDEIHYIYDNAVYHYQQNAEDVKLLDIEDIGYNDGKAVLNDGDYLYVFQRNGEDIEISKYSKPNYERVYYKKVWLPGLMSLSQINTFGDYLYILAFTNVHVINTVEDTYITRNETYNWLPKPFNEQGDIVNYTSSWRGLFVEIINAEDSKVEELTYLEPLPNRVSSRYVVIGDKLIYPYFTIDTSTNEIYPNDLDLTFEGYSYRVALNRINNSLLLLGDQAVDITDSVNVVVDSTTSFNLVNESEGIALFYDAGSEETYSWNGDIINNHGLADDLNLSWSSRDEDYYLLSECLIQNGFFLLGFHSLTTGTSTISELYEDDEYHFYPIGVHNGHAYYTQANEIIRVNCDGNLQSIYTSTNSTLASQYERSFFYRSENKALLGTEDGVLSINSDNSVELIDTVDFQFTQGFSLQDGSHALHINSNSNETIIFNDGEFIVTDIGDVNEWNLKYLGEQTYWNYSVGLDTFYSATEDQFFDFIGLPQDFKILKIFQKGSESYVAAYNRDDDIKFRIYDWNRAGNQLTSVAEVALDSDEYYSEFHSIDENCVLMTTQRILVIDNLWSSYELNNIKPANSDSQLTTLNSNAYFFAIDPKYGKQLYELDFSQDFSEQDASANETQYLTVYPNPSSSSISIAATDGQKFMHNRYTVFNTLGQVLSTGLVGSEIDVSMLPVGQYFIVISKGEARYFGKFIKG